MDLLRQLKEVALSVLPIAIFAVVLSLAAGVMDGAELGRFMLSCLLVIAGLTIFLRGVDIGITPIGNRIGGAMTKSRSLPIMLIAAAILGMIITIPEPDVQVLASQVHQVRDSISVTMLVMAIAAGVGIFFAVSIARTILGWPMKAVIFIGFAIIFLIAAFTDDFFVMTTRTFPEASVENFFSGDTPVETFTFTSFSSYWQESFWQI